MDLEGVKERVAALDLSFWQVGVRPAYSRWNADGTRTFFFGDEDLHDERFVSVQVGEDYLIVIHDEVGTSHVHASEAASVASEVARKVDDLGWLRLRKLESSFDL